MQEHNVFSLFTSHLYYESLLAAPYTISRTVLCSSCDDLRQTVYVLYARHLSRLRRADSDREALSVPLTKVTIHHI